MADPTMSAQEATSDNVSVGGCIEAIADGGCSAGCLLALVILGPLFLISSFCDSDTDSEEALASKVVRVTASDGNTCVMRGQVPESMHGYLAQVATSVEGDRYGLQINLRREIALVLSTGSLDAKSWMLNMSQIFESAYPDTYLAKIEVSYNGIRIATAKNSVLGGRVVDFHD